MKLSFLSDSVIESNADGISCEYTPERMTHYPTFNLTIRFKHSFNLFPSILNQAQSNYFLFRIIPIPELKCREHFKFCVFGIREFPKKYKGYLKSGNI